jgi:hypothetical protein
VSSIWKEKVGIKEPLVLGIWKTSKEINRFHERTGKESMVFFVTSSSKDPENPPRGKIGASSLTVLRFGFRLGLEFKVKVRFCRQQYHIL